MGCKRLLVRKFTFPYLSLISNRFNIVAIMARLA